VITPSTSSDAGVGHRSTDISGIGAETHVTTGSQASSPATPLFPQGSNDVLEVLCSGEPTAGKILMHFMLFYGQLFDALGTSIDVRGTHHPDYHRLTRSERQQRDQRSHRHQRQLNANEFIEDQNRQQHPILLSSFIPRKPGGSIDPVSGMFTVDPIVIYDPLEGAESNNVSKSCFAWGTIRNVFAQCYMTLSGVVERGVSSSTPPSAGAISSSSFGGAGAIDGRDAWKGQRSDRTTGATVSGEAQVSGRGAWATGFDRPQDQRGNEVMNQRVNDSAVLKEHAPSTVVDGGSSVLALLFSF